MISMNQTAKATVGYQDSFNTLYQETYIFNNHPRKDNTGNEDQKVVKSGQPDQVDKCNSKCQAEFLGKLKKVGKKELAKKFGKCMRKTVSCT